MTSTLRGQQPESRPPRGGRARERARRAAEWAHERVPWVPILVAALERERIAAAGLLAGGLAYRLFFWVVPLGLVLAAILSFWVEADPAGLESAAREFGIGGAATSAATAAIESEAHARWYFLLVGLWLLGWFGIGVVRALYVTHAVAWQLRPDRLERPLRAGLVFSAVMLAAIVASAGAQVVRERVPEVGIVLWVVLLAAYGAAFVWGSTLLPNRASHWRAFVPGAVLLAVGTQLLQVVVALYLAPRLGRSSALYGTLGAATVVLLWLYLEARLVVGAAFLNAALWERRQAGRRIIPTG